MTKLTPLQQFARAQRIVGSQLRIRWSEESPVSVIVTDDQITVVLSVARRSNMRGGSKITHQGTRGYVYRARRDTSGWMLSDEFEVVNKLDEPILEVSFGGLTEDEYMERKLHEDMCHRPGWL